MVTQVTSTTLKDTIATTTTNARCKSVASWCSTIGITQILENRMEVVNRYYMMIYVNRFDRFGMVWLCLTYIWTAKRGQLRHCCVHVSSPAATKETGTPWASERIACVAPVEEESQGCLKMIEMHHGPKNEWLIRGIIMIYPWHTWLL